MQYSVHSRGRPIGVTDLGFARTGGPYRAGWFHPNALGQQVMAVVTALHVALQASARRHVDERRHSRSDTSLGDGALPPELAEALENVGALELTLHREDGSIVPTEVIGLQDTEQLQVMARMHLSDDEPALSYPDDDPDAQLDAELREAIEHDVAEMLEAHDFDDDEPWRDQPWRDAPPPTEWPRYQVQLRLVNEWDVP